MKGKTIEIHQGEHSVNLNSQFNLVTDSKVTVKESHNSDFLKSENGPEKESKSFSWLGKIIDLVKSLFGLFKRG